MPKTNTQPALHYEIDDHTDPWKDRPYIVLQHGFGRNGRFWYKWIPLLSRHYRVLRLDMRGFGQSRDGFSLGSGFNLDDLAADVIKVLDNVGARNAHFVGEAFGGTLGMQVAGQYPDRIRTLSLLSAPVFLLPKLQTTFALGETSWADAIKKHGIKKWAEQTNNVSRFPPYMGPGFLDWYNSELARTDPETLAKFTELCRAYDQTKFLSQITAPVLGVFSTTREEQVEALRKHVKRLNMIKLDTEYFMVFLSHTEACADAVLHFASQHDGFSVRG